MTKVFRNKHKDKKIIRLPETSKVKELKDKINALEKTLKLRDSRISYLLKQNKFKMRTQRIELLERRLVNAQKQVLYWKYKHQEPRYMPVVANARVKVN